MFYTVLLIFDCDKQGPHFSAENCDQFCDALFQIPWYSVALYIFLPHTVASKCF